MNRIFVSVLAVFTMGLARDVKLNVLLVYHVPVERSAPTSLASASCETRTA